MKKLGLGLCLSYALFATSSAYAGGWKYNWLGGISAGYAAQDGTYHLDSDLSLPVGVSLSPTNIGVNQDDDYNGFIWGLLLGYQAKCNGWVMGVELNVDFQNIDENHHYAFTALDELGVAATINYNRETIIGLSGRFGYELSCYFAPYIRLGLVTSKDRLTNTFSPAPGIVPIAITVQNENSRWQYSFLGGIGFEVDLPMVISCPAIRFEYDYISKCTKGHNLFIVALDATQLTVDSWEKPHEQVGKVSLVWDFM